MPLNQEDEKELDENFDIVSEIYKVDEQLTQEKSAHNRPHVFKNSAKVKQVSASKAYTSAVKGTPGKQYYLRTPSTNHTLRSSPRYTHSINQCP